MSSTQALVEIFGQRGGAPVIYLHGAPGAPAEAELIAAGAHAHRAEILAVDRARVAPDANGAEYLDRLTDLVARLDAGRRLPIFGFSIGAALALRIAARLKSDAGPLFLLSAAGPLDLPGAFDGMGAGARVFKSAQSGGASFAVTVAGQALLAHRSPGLLRKLLFAGADGNDRAFAATPEGRAILARVYARAWAGDGRSYRRDLVAYVEPWSDELRSITSPVQMWHGVGDTWAPLGMARGLAQRLPMARLQEVEGGHYTTLINQAPVALAAAS